jgi:hypothetical protein
MLAGLPAGGQDSAPSADAILVRVKAGLRSVDRPPFVAYTLVRHDTVDGVPDFLDSYTLRIWCRTSDSGALSRRVIGAHALGPAEFIVPAFDKPIDPGPPTADLLDVIRQAQPADSGPPADRAAKPPPIGSVLTIIESTYHVVLAGNDGSDYHLRLVALRDPDRNRLTDLYVDRTTYALHRAVAHDHLYAAGDAIPVRFEIEFGDVAGVPVIVAIHGQTDTGLARWRIGAGLEQTVDYRFEDVRFPADLPAWYFEPAHYGEHRDEFPP